MEYRTINFIERRTYFQDTRETRAYEINNQSNGIVTIHKLVITGLLYKNGITLCILWKNCILKSFVNGTWLFRQVIFNRWRTLINLSVYNLYDSSLMLVVGLVTLLFSQFQRLHFNCKKWFFDQEKLLFLFGSKFIT